MFEEILEVIMGPVGLIGVALVALPGGRKVLRQVAKAAIHAGLTVSEAAQEAFAEAKERTEDFIEEVKAEEREHAKNDKQDKLNMQKSS